MATPDKDTDLPEALAALAHEQWSGWMEYLFSKGTFNEDDTWTMPAWAVKHWKRQMNTPYADLSETEQDGDRVEAARVLQVFQEAKAGRDVPEEEKGNWTGGTSYRVGGVYKR